MNDTLEYFKLDPYFRSGNYHALTFSMMYYYSESFLLPLSHDETVHGKASIVNKMNGDYEKKFPQARSLYTYMCAHPGKKLNFMGNEFAQFREWDENREQDWDMLKYPIHDSFHHFMRDLNLIYLHHSSLWEKDYCSDGFKWLDCHMEKECSYAFERSSNTEKILAVFNFSGIEQTISLKVNCKSLKLLLASDRDIYGGETHYSSDTFKIKKNAFTVTLPPFASHIYLENN